MDCNIDGSHGEYVLYRLTNRILTRYCPYQSRSTTNQHLNSQNPRDIIELSILMHTVTSFAILHKTEILSYIGSVERTIQQTCSSNHSRVPHLIRSRPTYTSPNQASLPTLGGISHSLLLRHFDCAAGVLLASGGVHILSC